MAIYIARVQQSGTPLIRPWPNQRLTLKYLDVGDQKVFILFIILLNDAYVDIWEKYTLVVALRKSNGLLVGVSSSPWCFRGRLDLDITWKEAKYILHPIILVIPSIVHARYLTKTISVFEDKDNLDIATFWL